MSPATQVEVPGAIPETATIPVGAALALIGMVAQVQETLAEVPLEEVVSLAVASLVVAIQAVVSLVVVAIQVAVAEEDNIRSFFVICYCRGQSSHSTV